MGITISDFYCTQCGKKALMIPRNKGRQREPGHLKKIFCIHCQKENNCVEVKSIGSKYQYEDFLLEFVNHNFNEDGTRKIEYSQFKRNFYK